MEGHFCPTCGTEVNAHAVTGVDVKGKPVWSYRCSTCDKVYTLGELKIVEPKTSKKK